MPEVQPESYSNPMAPPEQEPVSTTAVSFRKANLSNEDFRKLMMTPRPSPASAAPPTTNTQVQHKSSATHAKGRDDDERREKKKSFYSKLKKEEEERQLEWAKKYRDRAKERRDDSNPDLSASAELPSSTSYKAVAPGFVDLNVIAEKRKQAIVESKFLGGDIEHTHLVKGLDYVLLDKIRGEIHTKHKVEDELNLLEKKREREKARAEYTEELKFTTTLGKNVYRALFQDKPLGKNELFSPGRMAYVFDLEDEYAESDIPTTLIRSKTDCPTQETTTLTTNDIVINKLTQILSYLRQGMRSGRKGKKKDRNLHQDIDKTRVPVKKILPGANQSIFDDVGEYVFDPSASSGSRATTHYFDKPARNVESEDIYKSTADFVQAVNTKYSAKTALPDEKSSQTSAATSVSQSTTESKAKKTKGKSKSGGISLEGHYAECYPGGLEEYDANYDSDEDADFTKMDMGNKKGPVKRWDFENEEDYNKYQSKREALPKAAFQYGVKMSEGRKTRRYGGANMSGKAKEKAKLDREWQQISALLDKRKGGGGASSAKRPKLDRNNK